MKMKIDGKKVNKTPFGDYETSLLQMSPLPCQEKKIVHSSEVKKYHAFSKFTMTWPCLGVLNVYEENLNYLKQKENLDGKRADHNNSIAPRLIRNVQPLSITFVN